jgi:homoserine kinase
VTRIAVPASVANVGPGFDVFAFAVDLWLEVEAEPAAEPHWTWEGESAGFLAAAPNPFSALPFRGVVRNRIPVGVGLGSSAAARVAAFALQGEPEPWWAAARAEGHPDNAVAAGLGGFCLIVGERVLRLPEPEVDVALLVAFEAAPTEHARTLLPPAVPFADAIFNAGRTAWLVHLIHTGRLTESPAVLEDRLHQPYRRSLYPWAADAIEAAASLGAPAAIAGAGPSVFAFAERGRGAEVAAAMIAAAPGKGRPLVTRIARSGITVEA